MTTRPSPPRMGPRAGSAHATTYRPMANESTAMNNGNGHVWLKGNKGWEELGTRTQLGPGNRGRRGPRLHLR
eukprot:11157344-Lingulodinium_polyedra.AAC.1